MSAITKPLPVEAPQRITPAPAPAPPAPRRPWKWLILLAIVGVVGWAVYQATRSGVPAPSTAVAPSIRTVRLTQGTLEQVSRVTGQTAALNFSNVIAPILRGPESGSEMVLLYLAPPGSRVKKGQLIAKIDGQSTQDHVDDIADTIEEAQSDVIKRKAEHGIEWEILQQTLRVAKSEFEKWKLDYGAAEVRTEIEQQLMKLSLDEAEARYKQLQADLASTQASQKAEIRILELTRDRHASHRGRHANDLQKFTIHAPMDGLAVMLSTWRGGEMGQIQQGDSIRPGQGFMKIVSTDDMIVEGTINQAESSLFRIGQEARVHLDAFPGLELKGRVHSIGALAVGGWRQNYYIRNIPLRVRIDGVDSRLIPDLSASADVVHAREENRVLVPLNAVRTEDGKTFAYVKNGESFERREVELGLRNELHAAVLAGLDSGDEVRILD